MSVQDILNSAINQGIYLYLRDGELRYKAKKGSVPNELKEQLKRNKAEITGHLAGTENCDQITFKSIRKRSSKSDIPLSYSQQRLWFLDQVENGSQYNISANVRYTGELEKLPFRHALSALFERHEILRSMFLLFEGEPRQTIVCDYDLPLTEKDLSLLDTGQQKLQIDQMILDQENSRFDLGKDLMFRIRLLKLSDTEHVILFTMHHIISDGWSMVILQKELSALYTAFCKKQENPLLPLTIQYSDYSRWQLEWLQGDILKKQISYWKQQLEGLPLAHGFPLDKPRSVQRRLKAKDHALSIDKLTSDKIRTLCVKYDVTLFVFLQTVFTVLVGRYSDSTDVVVGSPISGRTHSEIESLIGFFVNSLVIRTDLSGNPTFKELLKSNKDVILNAYSHQHVPFEMIVKEVCPERYLNQNPLFQIMFTMQNSLEAISSSSRIVFEEVDSENHLIASRFDLEVQVHELTNCLALHWIYDIDLFKKDTVKRLSNNYSVLLNSVIESMENPQGDNKGIEELTLLSAGERKLLLVDWNATQEEFPEELCLHELFESQVTKTPDMPGLVVGQCQLSYLAVNSKANQIARYLNEKGVTPDTLIGLCVERSTEMIIGILGILKAGAAYVPIDPTYPQERIRFLLEDAKIEFVVSQSTFAGKIQTCLDPEKRQRLLYLDTDTDNQGNTEIFSRQSTENIAKKETRLKSTHLAYVIYTSGSTGNPKGVMIQHRALVNRLVSMQKKYAIDVNDTFIQKTPYTFDVSVWELLLWALSGSTLSLLEPNDHKSPVKILEGIKQHSVSIIHFVPSMLAAFLDEIEHNTKAKAGLSSLRLVISSGEALASTLVNRFNRLTQKFGLQARIVNLYGPTEATIDVTSYDCSIDERMLDTIPIGKPVTNTQLYVLNDYGSLSPISAVGELHIGGLQLAKGYLSNPELTAEKFVTKKIWGKSETRLYKTGDRVRWLADGNLEFIGRVDDQVKIRGMRIELGELEFLLRAHSSLDKAAVIAQSKDQGEKQIVAYVCPTPAYLNEVAAQSNSESVAQWATVFDEQYTESAISHDPQTNFVGWNDSYSGRPIPFDQMQEWLEGTQKRISQLNPQSLLEIGCGTGLLLYGYGDSCRSVCAMDVSAQALSGIQHELQQRNWSHVQLIHGDALSIDSLAGKDFDTVVINSVVQYFPNRLYLEQMIEKLLPCVMPGGKILIGDVRNLDLITSHVVAIEHSRISQGTPAGLLANRVNRRIQQEKELLVSPSFFAHLPDFYPEIEQVDILLKRGVGTNEMMRYRYDVVLTKRSEFERVTTCTNELPWFNYDSIAELKNLASKQELDVFGVSGIPNWRIINDVALAGVLSKWQETKVVQPGDENGSLTNESVEQILLFESVLQYASECGYRVELTWSQGQLDQIDVIFSRHDGIKVQARNVYSQSYQVNCPQLLSTAHLLFEDLKIYLGQRLPEYMLPNIYIAIEALPLSPNGKVDKKALPISDESDLQREAYVAPQSRIEQQLCEVWQGLLNITQIGVDDNFFNLGGHSLLAIRLVNEIQKQLERSLPPKQLFESPTVAGIAVYLLEHDEVEPPVILPTIKADTDNSYQAFSLTGVQQAYLFGRSNDFELGNVATHSYFEIDVPNLSVERLSFAWNFLIRRHGMLRAVFDCKEVSQRILAEVPEYCIKILDVSEKSTVEREESLIKTRTEMSHQVLAPDQWPLFDLRVTRLDQHNYRLHYSKDTLISDAASENIIATELRLLYRNPETVLPVLAISFRDYVVAEESIKSSVYYKKSKNYWLNRLVDFPPAPVLPLAKRPSEIDEPQFANHEFILPVEQWNLLQRTSRSINVTPTVLIINLFSQVLSRWCKNSRFTLNLTLFNRLPLHEQVNALVGDFTSLTLLEIDVNGREAFSNAARRIQRQLWSDIEHRYFGGTEVLRAMNSRLGAQQSVAMPVVFTSTLGVDQENAVNTETANLTNLGQATYGVSQTSQVWLDHVVSASPKGLRISWMVLEELFPANLITEMFSAYRELLHWVSSSLANVNRCYNDLPGASLVITSEQTHQQINNTPIKSADKLLHNLFQIQVEKQDKEEAIVAGDIRLTYGEVHKLAFSLSLQIAEYGIKPNVIVAVVMEKGWEQVVAVLGVLYSGAAYLPIDANLPPERIRLLLSQGQIELILTQTHIIKKHSFLSELPILKIDSSWLTQLSSLSTTKCLITNQEASNLAYIIFTSGSTGIPKGVMIDHRGAVNTVLDINQRFGIGHKDKILALSSLNFDLSVYDIFGTLAAGGTLVIPEAEHEKNPQHWVELVRRESITIWNSVPALAQLYVDQIDLEKSSSARSNLRLVLLSGDWIGLELPERLKQLDTELQIISLGGATEASIWSIYFPIYTIDKTWKSIPYGRALSNQNVTVLGRDFGNKPCWVVGEIYIGGVGVAKGYWDDSEKTMKSFVAHPDTGERLYKTGDLGRYLPDGNIEFLGREDNQVKIHGHRIELGEIESILCDLKEIKEAVVTAVGDDQNRCLVGYLIPEQHDPIIERGANSNSSFADTGVEIYDSAKRSQFKLEQRGLRDVSKLDNGFTVFPAIENESPLIFVNPIADKSKINRDLESSHEPMSLALLGDWLACLRQLKVNSVDHPLPKRHYPSAGALYPLQIYLYINSQVVRGLSEGFYYYDPSLHQLIHMSKINGTVDQATLPSAIKTETQDFSLLLVAQTAAILPLYGNLTEKLCLLEAGHISYLLRSTAASHSIAIKSDNCGGQEHFENYLSSEKELVLMHSLQGSRVNEINDQPTISLSYLARQSYRKFLPVLIGIEEIEVLLSTQASVDFLVYVQFKSFANGSDAAATSLYQYNGSIKKLTKVASINQNNCRLHGENEALYNRGSICLYMVNDTHSESYENLAIQAGYLGQSLMSACTQNGIGMCPIGSMDFSPIRECLQLNENQQLLYGFIGGRVSVDQTNSWPAETGTKVNDSLKIQEYLLSRVPRYMVPKTFVFLEKFPLTANGKVDVTSLRIPDKNELRVEDTVAPTNDTEIALCALWRELLEIDQVGVHDNFFVLGGHSVLAMRLVNLIKQRLGIELSLRMIFENYSISLLARIIDKQKANNRNLSLHRVDRNRPILLSFAQQRLWFLTKLENNSSHYNIPLALRLRGQLDKSALIESIKEIVNRHEVLRTRFVENQGVACQIIDQKVTIEIEEGSFIGEQDLMKSCESEANYSFNLGDESLIRAVLLRRDDKNHALLITIHHSVSDAWSMNVFFRELMELYNAFSNNRPSPLIPLSIQYADFSHWQRERLNDTTLQTQLQYWQKQLSDMPPCLALPFDRSRPEKNTFRGSNERFCFEPDLLVKLNQLSQEQDVTLFMLLMSVFTILLNRYCNQTDINIGTPIADRNRVEIENLIGFFTNTLVLRTDVSGNPLFGDFLLQVKEMTLSAYDHQDIPFEYLVQALQVERSLSYSPLFQVMFVLHNKQTEVVQSTDICVSAIESDVVFSKFDLTLNLQESESGLQGIVEYNTDLFDRATILRLVDHYERLLNAILANCDQRISQLEFLSESELHQQLFDWNKTKTPYPQKQCLHQLLEAQVDKSPDSIALVFEDQQLSYFQLNQQANRLAHYLIERGVGLDVRVGICLERGLNMVIGILGILKAGGCYIPLDPDYPRSRLDYILEDAEVTLLLTESVIGGDFGWPSVVFDGAIKHVYLDQVWGTERPTNNPMVEVLPSNLAYVIYTSGSTGKPKGVMGLHCSSINRLQCLSKKIGIESNDVFAQKTSIGFVDHVAEIFQALSSGCPLIIVPTLLLQSPELLVKKLTAWQVSQITMVPSLLNILLASGHAALKESKLRVICSSGEALDLQAMADFQEKFPKIQLLNIYGSTEVGADVSVYAFSQQHQKANSVIGNIIENTDAYVLDSNGNIMPQGVVGELYIGGIGLSRGYLYRSALTAEKFIPNPFNSDPGSRLYRTGDLVRFLSDGQLDFIGRLDEQIKLRGFRIEVGEIEQQLNCHPWVQTSVVKLWEDGSGDKYLVAYVILISEQCVEVGNKSIDNKDDYPTLLRTFLERNLPNYMIPRAYVTLAAFPLMTNGKIDKKALQAPDESAYGDRESIPPEGFTEELLASLWCKVLGHEQVGRFDNFFVLGGHSLLVTQLVSRIRDAFAVELSIRTLFEQQTLLLQAQAIEQAQSRQHHVIVPLEPVSRDQPLFLSYAQQRLWFLSQFMGPSPVYNMPLALRLRGKVNPEYLIKSLNTILERHEVLRSHFERREGEIVQVIDASSMDLQVEEVVAEAALKEIVRAEQHYPFDLSRDALCRFRLLHDVNDNSYALLVTMHHSVSDGWSLGIFFRELVALYRAYIAGEASPLAPLSIQYADYAQWQRRWLQGEVLENQLAYWREQLRDLPPLLTLPTDRPRPAEQTFRGSSQTFAFPNALSKQLQALSREHGVTLFMTLLSAFAVLLSRYSGLQDVAIGTPIANRTRGETEGLIGFFVNTLVMRSDLTDNPRFVDLLKRTREMSLHGYAHQDIPFEHLVENLNPERSLSHSPLFQVMFALQNMPVDSAGLTALELTLLEFEESTKVDEEFGVSRFDLTLSVKETPKGIIGGMEYNTDLFDRTTIIRFLDHYQCLLAAIVVTPNQRVLQFAFLTAIERQQQLIEWNDTATSYPKDCYVHQLFEAQVEKSPEAIALVFEDQQLSYNTLNQRANHLAYTLQAQGVGPDVRVGICLERSQEMVIAIIGILKAGGCYVPLDPKYPLKRLEYLIEDSGIELVVTTRLDQGMPELLRSSCNKQTRKILYLDDYDDVQFERANPETLLNELNLAYLIFTSGSTGKPKGVGVNHQGVGNLLQWYAREFSFSQEDRVLVVSSFCFDLTQKNFFASLLTGGQVRLVPELFDPISIVSNIQHCSITTLNLTPSAFYSIISILENEESLSSLRQVILGGEAIQAHRLKKFVDSHPNVEIINSYGPTECSDVSAFHRLRLNALSGPKILVPIGRVISNTQTYVVDKLGQHTPIGVVGELVIGGKGVSRGYVGSPSFTAQQFIPHSFSQEPGERLYRTGDLVRYSSDGNLEFLGRIDHQVKVRGFRIELGEIENVLSRHRLIKNVAVLVREDEEAIKKLVAYVVLKPSESLGAAAGGKSANNEFITELRAHVQDHLPSYMAPTEYVELTTLPLTTNGKVDRKALPQGSASIYDDAPFKSPNSAAEKIVAEMWAKLLNIKVEKISINANFFSLGGHSLLATQFVNSIKQNTDMDFPLRKVFEEPTIKEISARLSSHLNKIELDKDIDKSSSVFEYEI